VGLIKQSKSLNVEVANFADAANTILVHSDVSTPAWVTVTNLTLPGNSTNLLAITVDLDFFGGVLGEHVELVTLAWSDLVGNVFPFELELDITISSIYVTPDAFSFFTDGIDLVPADASRTFQVFNTLCENAASIRIQNYTRTGDPIPPWFEFETIDPFTVFLLEPQRGLPFSASFGFNPNALVLAPTPAGIDVPSAEVFSFQLVVDIELIGLNVTITNYVEISFGWHRACPVGTFSRALTGDDGSGCDQCIANFYSAQPGSTICTVCPEDFPRTAHPGSANSSSCVTDKRFFEFNGTSVSCPSFANCDMVGMTLETLQLKQGNWRASSKSTDLLECPVKDYCVGGVQSDLCAEGHEGAFCFACVPGKVKRSELSVNDTVVRFCTDCDAVTQAADESRIVGIFFALSLALAVFIFAICTCACPLVPS
jgi:hypothetical protein